MAGVALLLVAGCSGPIAPLSVDVHAVGSDITLGDHNRAVAGTPLPPYVLPVDPGAPEAPPSVLVPERPGVPLPSVHQPPPGPCPTAPPLSFPVLESGSDAPTPPAAGTYLYRTKGAWTAGGKTSTYPTVTKQVVSAVAWDPSGQKAFYEFTVTATLGSAVTTARYRVVPANGLPAQQAPPVQPGQTVGQPPQPPTQAPSPAPTVTTTQPPNLPYVAAGDPAQSGVYLLSIASGSLPAETYNGSSGLLLAQLPIGEGNGFQSTATAGSRTFTYSSVVGRHGRVDACGEYLDSWTVHLTGSLAQADADQGPVVDVDDTYQLAPQFGGLILASHEKTTSGSSSATGVLREVTTTINSVPKVGA